jgi:hypothetical protein
MQKLIVICDVCGNETEVGREQTGKLRIGTARSEAYLAYDLCPGCMAAVDATASGLPTVVRLGLEKLGRIPEKDVKRLLETDAMARRGRSEPSEEDHGTVRGTLLPAGSLSRLADRIGREEHSEEDSNA